MTTPLTDAPASVSGTDKSAPGSVSGEVSIDIELGEYLMLRVTQRREPHGKRISAAIFGSWSRMLAFAVAARSHCFLDPCRDSSDFWELWVGGAVFEVTADDALRLQDALAIPPR